MPKAKKTDFKRFEKQEARRLRNRSVRATVKTFVGRARQTATPGSDGEQTQEAVLRAIRELDRAAQKGIIHRNNAARRKSRLLKHVAQATGATA